MPPASGYREYRRRRPVKRQEYSQFARLGCTVERRKGDIEVLRDLNDGDIGIGHQRIAAARKLQRLARRWPIRDSA